MGRILQIIAGIVVAVCLLGANAPSGQTNKHQANKAQTETQAAALAEQEKAESAAQEAAAERARNQSDLAAQESMAVSAAGQLGEIKIQTWAVVVGVVLSGFASIVSGTALLVSMANGRRQLRAHLFPAVVAILDGALAKPKNRTYIDWPGAHIVIANTGQTPAKDAISWAAVEVLPVADEGLLVVEEPKWISPSYVPANGNFRKTVNAKTKMTPAEKAGVIAGTHAIFVHGIVIYADTFGERRTSRFRLKYAGAYPPPSDVGLWFCDQGNEAD